MTYDEAMKIAKNPEPSFSELLNYAMHAPTVEPHKRKKGEKYPTHQMHRFPLRHGISKSDVMVENLCRTTPLLDSLRSCINNVRRMGVAKTAYAKTATAKRATGSRPKEQQRCC